MGLKHRVAKLEKDAGAELCSCPFEQLVVVQPGGPVPPPPPRAADGSCLSCGGRMSDLFPQIIIRLSPDSRDAPDGEKRWD